VGAGKGIFSLYAKRPRREVELVRGLKISWAIFPLPSTSFNGVQRGVNMIFGQSLAIPHIP
jgi:hypothetical protein